MEGLAKQRIYDKAILHWAPHRRSELEAAREVHDAVGVISFPDLSQLRHVLAIHLFQRRPEQCIIGVMSSMLQVLAVLDSGLDQLGAQCAHVVIHISIKRFIGPSEVETRREDSMRPVGWERGWSSVCEDVVLERVKAENDQCIIIVLTNSVTPGLCRIRSVIQ